MMQLTERRFGAVSVIDVSGTMIGDEGDALRDTVARMLEDGQRQIVLNLSELTYIDSVRSAISSPLRCGPAASAPR